MSFNTSIKAFVKVIEAHSNVISAEDWVELASLTSNLPEDEEEVEEVLENWLKTGSRSQVLQAYKQELGVIVANSALNLDEDLGVGGSKSPTNPNQPSLPAKELIENAIKRNSPLSDNKKTN